MINENKLNLYLENDFNVLMSGKHGVGKTAVIKSVFEKAGLEWRYFSAATMDPWVDFIGVPKSVADENGKETLELIKPKDFALDKIEALFFDEFNRAHPKVMNAVMELIQFKSINGHKLNNLKVVWAAVNPWDEENTYEVEQIDPAVKDRFHVYLDIPYKIDTKYFVNTYGRKAQAYIDWWQELPQNIKESISPRRVEYALKINEVGGALTDVLPSNSNIKKLKNNIQRENKKQELYNLKEKAPEKIAQRMTLDNTKRWYDDIIGDKNLHSLIPYFHQEFIEQKIAEGDTKTTKKIMSALQKNNQKEDAEKINGRLTEVIENERETQRKQFLPYLENHVKKMSGNNLAKTFVKNLAETYVQFNKNNTDKNYFDVLFKEMRPELVEKVYKVLGQNTHSGPNLTESTFLPTVKKYGRDKKELNDSLSIFLGLLYQHAYIYQKNNSYYNNTTNKLNNVNKPFHDSLKKIKHLLSTINNNYLDSRAIYFAYGFSQEKALEAIKGLKEKDTTIENLAKNISSRSILNDFNGDLKKSVDDFKNIKIETKTPLTSKNNNTKKPRQKM